VLSAAREGGGLNVGVELAEESPLEWELQLLLPFRRGGGGGGAVRLDREGRLSVDGGKVLSTLSLELLVLSEYDRAWLLMFILGVRGGIVGGSDDSGISDSSSENGLCLEEELGWTRRSDQVIHHHCQREQSVDGVVVVVVVVADGERSRTGCKNIGF